MKLFRCAGSPSAARSFIQVANRSYSTTIAQSSTHLDFLLPRCVSTFPPKKIRQYPQCVPQTNLSPRQAVHEASSASSRTFSTSAIRKATVCVQNPVKDEDGKDMILEITARAAKRLSQIMAKDENPNLALRIQVESGGCHGFQYLMSLVTLPTNESQPESSVINEDDTIFEFVAEGSTANPTPQNAKIILDEPSLELLNGSKVDFTMELIGSEFKIVDNPHATSSCGCGTSFDIKM